ncbi:murein transglycosylase A [Kovacikia minuta CCNUW1]|uniref:murein transglycosylase A n=1 Tax=Kovacikia minuta TaxID=2931930 RepID=UPI001CCB3F81|nr:murein transglycosylase A [Kovacikia minuta]UBF29429.1 murein transglycosylase A [Kovacikia minuta CCNUW1]
MKRFVAVEKPPLISCLVGLLVLTGIGIPAISQSQSGTSVVQPKPAKPRQPLVPVPSLAYEGVDEQLWGSSGGGGDRKALLAAINRSLRYLQTDAAIAAYRRYPIPGITRSRVQRSLTRFRQLVLTVPSAAALQAAVQREFVFYQSTGKDGQGTVAFTGYFEPIHTASRVPTGEFRYPIYRLPPNFGSWKQPHPTRLQLEGEDGLQFSQGKLRGLELAWLRDRLEAYLIQVQGSARLQLTDGTTMSIGYAGHTHYPYTSIGKELVQAGKIRQEDLTLPALIQYFAINPADLDVYLPRNQRFVFFAATGGGAATGSLGVPVTPERSIATDKSIFPPGALALIQTPIPYPNAAGQLEQRFATRYVLDQDTGGAIKGAGRVDIFMGTGKQAGDRAGLINAPGKLYYLLLK